MSILEVIVLLVGGSVIAFLIYGAYRFWTEDADNAMPPRGPRRTRTTKSPTVQHKAEWPIEAVSGHRPS